jgi:hypothetical protein
MRWGGEWAIGKRLFAHQASTKLFIISLQRSSGFPLHSPILSDIFAIMDDIIADMILGPASVMIATATPPITAPINPAAITVLWFGVI